MSEEVRIYDESALPSRSIDGIGYAPVVDVVTDLCLPPPPGSQEGSKRPQKRAKKREILQAKWAVKKEQKKEEKRRKKENDQDVSTAVDNVSTPEKASKSTKAIAKSENIFPADLHFSMFFL